MTDTGQQERPGLGFLMLANQGAIMGTATQTKLDQPGIVASNENTASYGRGSGAGEGGGLAPEVPAEGAAEEPKADLHQI